MGVERTPGVPTTEGAAAALMTRFNYWRPVVVVLAFVSVIGLSTGVMDRSLTDAVFSGLVSFGVAFLGLTSQSD